MENHVVEAKAKKLFEYLLALNNLMGKVPRNYAEFEKTWFTDEFKDLPECFILDECEGEDLLEIYRPQFTEGEQTAPKPDDSFKSWLNFDHNNEDAIPKVVKERRKKDDEGVETIEKLTDNPDRIAKCRSWSKDWQEWSRTLKAKKKALHLYEELFQLISRLEKEGESLEFVFGKGILCWKHPVIGIIRFPLLTAKCELSLDPHEGKISIGQVDSNLKFERDVFSGVTIPNITQINSLLEEVTSQIITEDLSDFFNRFVRLLDAKGQYEVEFSTVEIKDFPIVYDSTIFSLRNTNERVLRNDLQDIIKQISTEKLGVPQTIQSILGHSQPRETPGTGSHLRSASSNDLYFPLPSNEQQKEIINRIEHNYGVTVQGPPGTGKTHTIANLVSHFLAEGKRVLITSQKENPLKVLKNKIPKDIQDLCVPVLGGGRESLQEIEKSIRTIGEKLGELDSQRLFREINRDKEQLDASKRLEATLKNQLKHFAEKEGTELEYRGERLFKYDVAKRLSEASVDYSWILDEVSFSMSFPLTQEDFQTLWNLKNSMNEELLKLQVSTLPHLDHQVMSVDDFSSMVMKGEALFDFDQEGQAIRETYKLPLDLQFVETLLNDYKTMLDIAPFLQESSYQLIINDCEAGGQRGKRWLDFLNEMNTLNDELFTLYNELINHQITMPEKDHSFLKEEVMLAKERLQSGKKPNLMFFMGKGKKTKYLFESAVLNGEPIKSLEDIHSLEVYITYEEVKKKAARIFNSNMGEIGEPSIKSDEKRFPHMLEERLNCLEKIIMLMDQVKALKEKYKEQHLQAVDLFSSESILAFANKIETVVSHLHYQQWLQQFNSSYSKLEELQNDTTYHEIVGEFCTAFTEKDIEKWKVLTQSLEALHESKQKVAQFHDLLAQLKAQLPLTGKRLQDEVGNQQPFPSNYVEAFELKKLQTWLDDTKDVNSTLLRKRIDVEQKKQLQLIQSIVSKSTWKSQVERITEEQKRALSAWKSYIKKIGKGTGKYASLYLKNARNEMKTAQSAIPVWIMPINQVLENFPVTNEQFDVIIFDESSQCNLFSINVLLRGKKVIVVGDDEQISPQSIGLNLEDVHELARRHLGDIPNANLFDGSISLYEIAEQIFPKEGKLMLREHFRCVPEIIHFSNDLSYGGEMIPLRLPLENEKIEPPVMAIDVPSGYNNDKDKDVNDPEADAIVDDIKKMIEDPLYDGQTFGVITLQGQSQHKVIETKIRKAIGEKEFTERKIICGNPYTLQGDERDIIFLSMIVTRNRNFRALTKIDEKQRYNVAASRARNQMRLYHSVDLSDLNSDDYRYRLLSYCQNPTRVNDEIENLEGKCESPFELEVLRMILAQGYKVTPQVQVGRYRIDLVIEGIRDRLAVECDGEKWHGPEKFEEDLSRQESLERAGWKFWRVRGREFYLNRKEAMESLWETLDKLGIERSNQETNEQKKEEKSRKTDNAQEKSEESAATPIQPTLTDQARAELIQHMQMLESEQVLGENIHFEPALKQQPSVTFSINEYFGIRGYEVIDHRDTGGAFWVVGDDRLNDVFQELRKRKNIIFRYASRGGKATRQRPAWYTTHID